jgi:hypothetical protein
LMTRNIVWYTLKTKPHFSQSIMFNCNNVSDESCVTQHLLFVSALHKSQFYTCLCSHRVIERDADLRENNEITWSIILLIFFIFVLL